MEIKKAAARGISFVYLSLVIHLYAFFLLFVAVNPNFLRTLSEMAANAKNKQEIENVIVETETESSVTPQHGKLSDKPNIDSGKPGDKNNYNYFNPNPDKVNRDASLARDGNDKKDPKAAASDTEITLDKDGTKKAEQENSDTASAFQKPSENRTSYYNPDEKVDVTMDNMGDISLATVPKEFASYFLNMQKKIGSNWREFFPVFQYYQGIIKSGEVHVRFQIDRDGNVKNAAVTKSYGYSILDESSLNAVIYSKNFGPLPKALRSMGDININFRFIYIAR